MAAGYAERRSLYNGDRLIKRSYYDNYKYPLLRMGGYASIKQVWDLWGNHTRTYYDENGEMITRSDGYSQVKWTKGKNDVLVVSFLDEQDNQISHEGINLITDFEVNPDGWSEWMMPETGKVNRGFSIGSFSLPNTKIGDQYSCQMEIEFKDVNGVEGQRFLFQTQGNVDGKWEISNIWNPDLMRLENIPEDGIYNFYSNGSITEDMLMGSVFEVGFRYDNWKNGAFRVRNVKIEVGSKLSPWSPGL